MHIPAKLRSALRKWDSGRGGKALAEVSTDMGDALQAGGVKLLAPMKSACGSLGVAIEAAQAAPQIPNTALQKRYIIALTRLTTAAADCRAAISVQLNGDEDLRTEENPALYHRVEAAFTAGVKDLYLVTVELAAATGREPWRQIRAVRVSAPSQVGLARLLSSRSQVE